jgi:hypothetical protein
MRTIHWGIAGLALALTVARGTEAAEPRCLLSEQSVHGGRIDVSTGFNVIHLPIGDGPSIGWQPPGSRDGVALHVGYWGSSLSRLGSPSGGHVDFRPIPSATSQNTEVVIRSDRGRAWRLSGQAIEIGTDDGGAPLGAAGFENPDLLAAIAEGSELAVEVRQPGAVTTVRFELSDTRARDELLAQARARVERADPTVCNRPVPVQRVN